MGPYRKEYNHATGRWRVFGYVAEDGEPTVLATVGVVLSESLADGLIRLMEAEDQAAAPRVKKGKDEVLSLWRSTRNILAVRGISTESTWRHEGNGENYAVLFPSLAFSQRHKDLVPSISYMSTGDRVNYTRPLAEFLERFRSNKLVGGKQPASTGS